MKQEIENGNFKVGIDWGSPEGDKTGYAPYIKTSMLFGKPKWYKRLLAQKSSIYIGGVKYYAITKDDIAYLYPAKKIKITNIRR